MEPENKTSVKHVVVIGGGFAGVAAGIRLKKDLSDKEVKVTLIDKRPYHLFTPSLYEVAASEAPQKNIVIPFEKIFGADVDFICSEVEMIDATGKVVLLQNKEQVTYDYLIFAVGSEPAYMGIPGLKEHSIGFKVLRDALQIKEKIKNLCCKEGKCDRKVQAVIGGGGFAGTELAAELLLYKDKIAEQNGLAKDCLEITIIQGSDRLLNELDSHVSDLAKARVMGPNVHFAFGGHINNVDHEKVYTDDDKSYPYHILIWTGGVEANHLAAKCGLPVNKRGQVTVNQFLQVEEFPNIFIAGDVAGFVDPKTQKSVPNVAQVAEEQGAIAGENVARLLHGEQLKSYTYRHFGYVVPLRGRFAVAELMYGIHFDGIWGWLLQQIVLLRYLLGILPFVSALKRWNVFELELEQ